MRRIPLLAAAIAALLPVTLLSTTGSASAASGKLTVKTYDRSGKVFRASVQIIDLATNQSWTVPSFKAKTLHKGTYAVVTDMWNPKDGTDSLGTDTLGATIVKVGTRATSTTIDARKGKPVLVGLDRPPADTYERTVRAAICAGDSAPINVAAWNHPGKLFVIPNSSKHLRFAYAAAWQNGFGGDLWMVSAPARRTVPAGVRRTFTTASLATVTAWARRGPAGGDRVRVEIQERTGCHAGYGIATQLETTPGSVRVHATAGKWTLTADWSGVTRSGESPSIGFDSRNLTLAAGRSYSRSFFTAAWGPGIQLPEMTASRFRFGADHMFTEPANPAAFEASQKSLVTLYDSKHRVVKKQTRQTWGDHDSGFYAKIKTKGWYTLQVDAQRYRPGLIYPADLLSPTTQAVFRMKLDPKAKPRVADVILPRLVPAGLTLRNQGRASGTTVVQIRPDRQTWDPDLVLGKVTAKTVTLQASYDGGRTWRSMPVRRTGGTWQATVANPASGAVTLRSRITTTKGAYAQVTIVRAYTVG
ncbi:hypothetical protein GCM10010168_56010 [Actinoplanes ianthinogenes]|uniref:Uncharacterized protein n=1 Tax=Actinoplanes ianthinogenes TaxID=122358 RepID=A0ABN6C7H7_9ACTN|nr:hypothetical protein [Actinoplanes ianthinogenes]BCJ41400.1 hypothetical protein Aiant_20570 [Actinoplanes ianthinogenes]GGR30398.1 hypothetical protein GCM10010168_56010 [Actinoplanes ianthinogenes]